MTAAFSSAMTAASPATMTTASSATMAAAAATALFDDDDMLDRPHGVVDACGGLCLSPVGRRGFLDLKGLGNSGRVGGAEDDRREREGNEEEHAGAALRESHAVRTWTRCCDVRTNAAGREIFESCVGAHRLGCLSICSGATPGADAATRVDESCSKSRHSTLFDKQKKIPYSFTISKSLPPRKFHTYFTPREIPLPQISTYFPR